MEESNHEIEINLSFIVDEANLSEFNDIPDEIPNRKIFFNPL